MFSRYCGHFRVLLVCVFSSRRNMLIPQSCTLVFKTVERFSHIRGCKHNWPNHVKILVHLYVDFFIFMFLDASKASTIITIPFKLKALEGSLRFHGKCLLKGSSVIGFGKVAFSPGLKTLLL